MEALELFGWTLAVLGALGAAEGAVRTAVGDETDDWLEEADDGS